MRNTLSSLPIAIITLAFVSLTIINSGCEPRPGFTGREVIVSHLGEITQDSRYLGDAIRYRIYYRNNTSSAYDVSISDKLDARLSDVKVLSSGKYDESTHTVAWDIENVASGTEGFVEFEANIAKLGKLTDKARIQPDGLRGFETNTVQTQVHPSPNLGWIPFDGVSREGTMPHPYMKDETTIGTMVNFDIPGMFVYETKVDEVTYHRLAIPGRAWFADVGKPEIPIVGELIEVPHGTNLSIDIVKSESIPLRHYNVYPAQEEEDQAPTKSKGFQLDVAAYLTDALYPAEPAAISVQDIGVIRGHRLVFLKVNPIQYNPVTREITAFSNIEVRLKFDQPAQIEPVDKRIRSEAFEELLEAAVLNYKDQNRFHTYDDAPVEQEEGCQYLIITHGDFYNASDASNPVVEFQDWKQQKGYKTRVVDVANIPDLAGKEREEDIREYLKDAYEKWNPPPTYVLLVGDAGDDTGNEIIPTHYKTDHPGDDYDDAKIGTDLYYVTVDGDDYFPDMYIGRLSVDTLAQAEDVIDKIIDYEKNPPATPANAAFYTNVSLIALFEDVDPVDVPTPGTIGDGREDRIWIECVEEVFDYLDNDYTPERLYNRSGNWATGPQQFQNGTNLPPHLAGLAWNDSDADITASINAGRFLVTYRDHGGRTDWSNPFGFSNTDINALTNGDLTPVVFSVACETGWFDNESDDDATLSTNNRDTSNTAECFCETFQRHSSGGAVAIIGATRVSTTGWNDFFMFGLHKAIWSDFDPNPAIAHDYALRPDTAPHIQTNPVYKMGQIHVFGQVFMSKAYNSSDRRKRQFEMYHLFGDPEMSIWTEAPATLKVGHPEGIGSVGQQDFVISVVDDGSGDPVQSAEVSLTRNLSIIAVQHTEVDGSARFTLNAPGAGDIEVTVTAHNYRPYQGIIEVNSGGAILNRLDPEDGVASVAGAEQTIHVGGQNFSGNEEVKLYFRGQYMDKATAAAGSFGQSGVEDVDIVVPISAALGPANVLAHGQSSDLYAVDVFQVRTANPIDLYTYSQWDNTTWHLHTGDNPIWNNPEIQLYDSSNNPVNSGNLRTMDTYTIKLKVHNDTDFDAEDVKVTFKWADFGAGQLVWEDIRSSDPSDPIYVEVDVPHGSVVEAEREWTPSRTGHVCIMAEIYHAEDINKSNNRGQENCHVEPTSSPAKASFFLWNPTDRPAAVHLELRQLAREIQGEKQRLWTAWFEHPEPQVIPPGKMREAIIFVDPKSADASRGEEAEFALTAFIDGRMIGGVNFIIINR